MNCIRKLSVIKSTLVSPRGKFGVGRGRKFVKYGGMSNDRSSDKKSHKVRFEQALFKQIGPQLLYGLPVVQQERKRRQRKTYKTPTDIQSMQVNLFCESQRLKITSDGYDISTLIWMRSFFLIIPEAPFCKCKTHTNYVFRAKTMLDRHSRSG